MIHCYGLAVETSGRGDHRDQAAIKRSRLERFRGAVAASDAQTAEHWRQASSGARARAMIELSEYAEMIARQTGIGKDPDEMFPGFAAFARESAGRRSSQE